MRLILTAIIINSALIVANGTSDGHGTKVHPFKYNSHYDQELQLLESILQESRLGNLNISSSCLGSLDRVKSHLKSGHEYAVKCKS